MDILLLLHSVLRYVILILILMVLFRSLSGWLGKKPYTPLDRKLMLFSVIGAHSQLVIGLILYFMSPLVIAGMADMGAAMKDRTLRFWTVEHIAMMVIAIVLITLASAMSKRAKTDTSKHKKSFILFLIAILLILASIPWPFMALGAGRGWL
jgi:hypothetical protein